MHKMILEQSSSNLQQVSSSLILRGR